MRYALVVSAFAGIVPVLAAGSPAQAQVRQIYPFCFVKYGPQGNVAPYQCGFTSFEQCMATARGTGGQCEKNPELLAQSQPATKARSTVRQ